MAWHASAEHRIIKELLTEKGTDCPVIDLNAAPPAREICPVRVGMWHGPRAKHQESGRAQLGFAERLELVALTARPASTRGAE